MNTNTVHLSCVCTLYTIRKYSVALGCYPPITNHANHSYFGMGTKLNLRLTLERLFRCIC